MEVSRRHSSWTAPGRVRTAGRARLQNGTNTQRAALEALFARRNASAAQRAIGEILNAWGEAAARETSLRRRMARALTRMANVRLHAAFRAIREVRVRVEAAWYISQSLGLGPTAVAIDQEAGLLTDQT